MNNSDYVILIDENGQPYIAHSVFTKARDAAKSAARSAHKYIARIGDRYFYTQEELKAFYNRGKAAAGKAAEAVRGAATKAATTAKSAASSVSKYASDRLGDVSDFVHRRNHLKNTDARNDSERERNDKRNSLNRVETNDVNAELDAIMRRLNEADASGNDSDWNSAWGDWRKYMQRRYTRNRKLTTGFSQTPDQEKPAKKKK